jgi:hypothetical protein
MSESTAGTVTSNTSTIQTTASGRGQGRGFPTGGRTNRTNNSRNNCSNNRGARPNVNFSNSAFKGSTADMNGHVFECYEERGDRTQFPKTLESLGEYASNKLKYPEDLKSMFGETMAAPFIVEPADLSDKATKREEIIWEASLKSFARRTEELRSNLTNIYAVIWGQCSEAMRTKLRALNDFSTQNSVNNCIWILNEIKGVAHQFDTKRNVFLSLLDARIAYYSCKQGPNQTNADYLEVFTSNVQVLEYYKANISESYLLIDDDNGKLTHAERTRRARGSTIAMAFLRGADPRRFSTLWSDLANQQTRGNDQYPTDLTLAYSMLVNYHAPVPGRNQQNNNQINGHVPTVPANHPSVPTDIGAHTFAQAVTRPSSITSTKAVPGTDGILHDNITCFNCNKKGHYASYCSSPTSLVQHVSLVQHAVVLAQSSNNNRYNTIPKHWILLDSQSSISVFRSSNMVSNIRTSPIEICANTNGGQQTSTLIADFKNLGVVWYNPKSIANILSLADVRKVCRVTMDTDQEAAMTVHKCDGTHMKFLEHADGLYYYDTHAINTKKSVANYTLLNTVSNNKAPFVTRDIELADKARELYRKLGRPSQQKFEDILKRNLIINCPITVDDAKRALIIYGPDLATLKGKTTRGPATPHVPSFQAVSIPAPILEHYQQVTLCVDFFFVQ